MAQLAYTRSGTGAPLVLLHGLGSSRAAWSPVRPALEERFDVICIDLPGFGDSDPLLASDEPTPARIAASVGGLLDELEVFAPHVVGNSLGGWVALELAGNRLTSSLTLLSPAGLWRRDTPRYDRVSLWASGWLARHCGGLLAALVSYRLGRIAVLGQTHGRPGRMSPEQARATIRAIGSAAGFGPTLTATLHRRYQATSPVTVPTTLAFGHRDLILLPWQSRHLDELPVGFETRALPGCGHVPMFDDPATVVRSIVASARRGTAVAEVQ